MMFVHMYDHWVYIGPQPTDIFGGGAK